MSEAICFSGDCVKAQISEILRSWGFSEEQVESSSSVMVEADLNGIDSHGIAMLIYYEGLIKEGKLNPHAEIVVEDKSPAVAVIDGGGGLGHAVSLKAIDLAIQKAKSVGVGVVSVRHSDHFGAAGYYAARAAKAGMVSLITSNGFTRCVVPAGGAVPMFSTNPVAFGAPVENDDPLTFDIATSTASIGKVNLAWLAGKAIPKGWVVDGDGIYVTDSAEARDIIYNRPEGGLTPLGGTPEMSAHKGYGICTMVEVLSAILSGATAAPIQELRDPDERATDTGHFFLVLDPAFFVGTALFSHTQKQMIDALRSSKPSDDARPVLVPGDIEWRTHRKRSESGIPLSTSLVEKISALAERYGAEFKLAH